MNEFSLKQWHDENLIFYKEFKPSFAQCTPDLNISWSEILRITSDSAGEEFTLRGMGWKFLKEKGIVLVVTRNSFKVNKMPKADQIIRLKTFECAPTGPLCTRDYRILDAETNELLISGSSLWTIINLNDNRLMPAKAYPYRPTPTQASDYDGLKPGKISLPENMETIASKTILFSDLDANGHTNNSKYINFAIDALPQEFQKKEIKNLRLNYSKEAHLGETLEIKAAYNPEEKKYTVQGLIDGNSSFECELYY